MSRVGPAAGFTLLELIVVLAIVGVLLTLGSLAVPDSARSTLDLEAARLVQTIQACQRGAVLSGVPGGVRIETGRYQTLQYRGRWSPSTRNTEGPHEVAAGLALGGSVEAPADGDEDLPQVVCLPSGETLLSPITLVHRAHSDYYEIGDDADGAIVATLIEPAV